MTQVIVSFHARLSLLWTETSCLQSQATMLFVMSIKTGTAAE